MTDESKREASESHPPFDTKEGAFVSNCVLHGDPNLMLYPKLIYNAPAPAPVGL